MADQTARGLRVGLFGIGLDTYWPQFAGLEDRLKGYLAKVEGKLRRPGVEVVSLGLIDTPEKAAAAGHQFRRADVDLIFLYGSSRFRVGKNHIRNHTRWAAQIAGSMQVRTLRRMYSSSRRPYARRWMTRTLLLSPSTKPSATLFSTAQWAAMPSQ